MRTHVRTVNRNGPLLERSGCNQPRKNHDRPNDCFRIDLEELFEWSQPRDMHGKIRVALPKTLEFIDLMSAAAQHDRRR